MNDIQKEKMKKAIEERKYILNQLVENESAKIKMMQDMVDSDETTEEVRRCFPTIFDKYELDGNQCAELILKLESEMDDMLLSMPATKHASVKNRTAEEILEDNGYEPDSIVLLKNESYDSALVGVSDDNRAVYSFDKMIDWYSEKNDCSVDEAIEWIEFNTLRAIPYAGAGAPIVLKEFVI